MYFITFLKIPVYVRGESHCGINGVFHDEGFVDGLETFGPGERAWICLTWVCVLCVRLQVDVPSRRLETPTWAALGGSPGLRRWPEVSCQQGAPPVRVQKVFLCAPTRIQFLTHRIVGARKRYYFKESLFKFSSLHEGFREAVKYNKRFFCLHVRFIQPHRVQTSSLCFI